MRILIISNKFVRKPGNELLNSCSSQLKCSPQRLSVVSYIGKAVRVVLDDIKLETLRVGCNFFLFVYVGEISIFHFLPFFC